MKEEFLPIEEQDKLGRLADRILGRYKSMGFVDDVGNEQ